MRSISRMPSDEMAGDALRRVPTPKRRLCMRKGILQRGLAIALSAAMLLTGISVPQVTARAEGEGTGTTEKVVYLDDMESAAEGWTVTWGDEAAKKTEQRSTNQWAKNNKTTWWNFEASAITTVTFTRTIPALAAGKYKASVDADGKKPADNSDPSGTIKIAGAAENAVEANMTFGEWDDFKTSTTDVLTLPETSDITLTITVTTNITEGWFDLDNIKLVQELSADESKTEEVNKLNALITQCQGLTESDYTADSWSALQTAITSAVAVKDAAESKTVEEIQAAITALQAAKDALESATVVQDAGVNVKKVENITEDFIRGVDISTYKSLIDSGVKFKDWEGNELDDAGFFTLLKNAGVNYVRIRVWNDPYADAEKKQGYGAGNCDVAKAKQMGKWATDAGLKVLIDFHYSDFWADPGRQVVPKAWKDHTVAQKASDIETFTSDSLKELLDAGVDVGMVQVGNETTSAICGEKDWDNMATLFNAGARAVHNVESERGKMILVALHFTNPEKTDTMKGFAKKLNDSNVDYDVFATSYYPYWHGTRENLTSVLKYVADTYGKKVMVAETSWARTMEDGDGQANVVRLGQNDDTSEYPATPQGQANEVRDVIEAVANVGEKGIGVMYWEPAWLPVNVYKADAEDAADVLAANKLAWETYGSGWASSYSIKYDPGVNENNYGGSEWDNQAMFDFEGNPLPSLNVYKYVLTGATAPKKLDAATPVSVDAGEGEDIVAKLPAKVSCVYNDGTKEELDVVWNPTDIAAITGFGMFIVNGTVTEEGSEETVNAVCTVNVSPKNLLIEGDFEGEQGGRDVWNITGKTEALNKNLGENPRTGDKCLAFYLAEDYELTATQSFTVETPGKYKTFMYLQGGNEGDVTAKITLSNDTKETFAEDEAGVKGWKVWQNPTVDEVQAQIGDVLTVTITITGTAGSWGSVDDVYLYQTKKDPVYNVAYNLDGGTNADTNPTKIDGSKEIALANPTKTGYVFEGWYTDSVFQNKVEKIAAGANADITLYAKWKEIEIEPGQSAINYVLDGGINHPENPTVYTEGAALEIKDPSKTGYTFEGWYTDAEFTTEFTGITEETTGALTLYAKWEIIVIEPGQSAINYVLDGGINHPENPTVYTEGAALEIKDPSKTGYTFEGWYTDAEFTTEFTGITEETTGALTLYAKWKAEEPDDEGTKVSGITLSAKEMTMERDKTFTLTAQVAPETATDKTLKWESSDAKVATVDNGVVKTVGPGQATITASATDGSDVKDACVVTVPYKVTYSLNGGSNDRSNPVSYYNQSISLKNPTRSKYTFSGWYTDSSFKNKVAGITQANKSDLTLYAKWSKVSVSKASLKSVKNSAKKKAKVTIKKVSGAKGYRIQYSTSKNFKKGTKTKTTTKTSYTLSGLKKGKTYYVRVCAYKLDSKNGKIYGKYGSAKKIKIKK